MKLSKLSSSIKLGTEPQNSQQAIKNGTELQSVMRQKIPQKSLTSLRKNEALNENQIGQISSEIFRGFSKKSQLHLLFKANIE